MIDRKGSWFDKYSNPITGGLGLLLGGGGVLATDDAMGEHFGPILKNIDDLLSTNLFIGIGTLCAAMVALLLPRLLDRAELIKSKNSNFAPTDAYKNDFIRMARSQQRFLLCLKFCIVGIIISLGFDSVLGTHSNELIKLADGASLSSILCASIGFLWLGTRKMIETINKSIKSVQE